MMVDADGTNLRSLLEPYRDRCNFTVALDYSPAISPDGTQIVFVTHRHGETVRYDNYEIATVAIDGTGFDRLTRNGAYDINPVWSPDGSRIAFLSDRDDPDQRATPREYRLYTMNKNGREVRSLAPSVRVSNSLPVWSPDGSKLAFLVLEGEQEERGYYDSTFNRVLYTIGADGSELTRLGEAFGQSAWSPDGEIPLNVSGDPTDQPWDQLVIASADGSPLAGSPSSASSGTERELIPGAFSPAERVSRYRYLSGITWSPDGSEILFSAPRISPSGHYAGVEIRTLFAARTDGTGLRPVWEHPAAAGQLSWSPDKTKIAVFGNGWLGVIGRDGLFKGIWGE